MQKAFLLIYTFLYSIALLFFLPKEYFKRHSNIRKRWIKEKFGFFNKLHLQSSTFSLQPSAYLQPSAFSLQPILSLRPFIWIHAVSVGEVIAIEKLVKELSKEHQIILSTITDTGQKVAQEKFKNYPVRVIYLPFDIPCAIKRTIKNFNPLALILTETELWPNLIHIASKKIPVIVVNGRLSEKSFKGYKKFKFFIKHLIKNFSLICVQEKEHKERFIELGADKEKIHVTGNMKFDIELKQINFQWESIISHPVILAGSTHDPEEEFILNAFLNLNIKSTLIIAPRHPERFNIVEKMIKSKIEKVSIGIKFSKLSDLQPWGPQKVVSLLGCPSACFPQAESFIILVDQMGILGSLYRVCDIAIIGGSFIPHGGQNPLEPAYWKKPIICGPYMHNFPFIEEFLKEKACLMVDKESLLSSIKKLISSSSLCNNMGEQAYKIFQKKSGATSRTLSLLKNYTALFFTNP
jgi:3-deoxy-D-manno-octulosonic-acid transferase